MPVPAGRRTRAGRAALLWLALLLGCQARLKDAPTGPVLPPDSPGLPPFTRAVFLFDVNLSRGTVTVEIPQVRGTGVQWPDGEPAPANSILGADAVGLVVSNFFSSAPGAVQPGKVRVQLDVQVLNKLVGYQLDTPTFPDPPQGETGLMLIPYSSVVTTTTGGVSPVGDGTVTVGTPSSGLVLASLDWNGHATPDRPSFPAAPGVGGLPHSFFNDAGCSAIPDPESASDCFRYETFGPLAAGALSASRRVGFDVDAGVGQFRALLLVVADLKDVAPISPGILTGQVSSPQRGPLSGVRIDVQGVGISGLTDAGGNYSIPGIGAGPRSVTVSGLPADCTPASLTPANGTTVTVPPGGTATLSFSVICTPVVGQVTGVVMRAGAGTQNLAGIQVIVQPAAAGTPGDTVPVFGTLPGTVLFSATVPVGLGTGAGAGTVRLSNIPAFCIAPPPGSYTGLGAGGSVEVGFTVQCDPPPSASRYVLRSRWGTPSGDQVDLTVSFDPSGYNDPLVNGTGPDGFSGMQVVTSLTGPATSRLTAVTAVAVSPFSTPILGGTLPIIPWLANTVSGDQFGLTDVAILRFAIGSGPAGAVTTSTTVQEVSTTGGDAFNLVPGGVDQNLDLVEATLELP